MTEATSPLLTREEQQLLLTLARAELETFFELNASGHPRPEDDTQHSPALLRPAGLFVTLHADNKLRGCIGMLTGSEPLVQAVPDLVVAAATRDPRFPAVTAAEVPDLSIELSVLSDPAPLVGVDQVQPGRHGLIVEDQAARGVLLPQVAIEQGWDGPQFLSQTCIKAGLSADSWHGWDRGENRELSVLAFTAQVFCEDR